MLDKILRGTITVVAGVSGLLLMNTLIPLLSSLFGAEFFRIGVFGVTMTTILSFLFGMLFAWSFGAFKSAVPVFYGLAAFFAFNRTYRKSKYRKTECKYGN